MPPHDNSNARKLDSRGAFLTFFKSLFGAGLLSLPNVLGRVGIVLGVTIYGLVGIGCAFSCWLLLEARQVTRQRLAANDGHHHLVTYGDLADILLGSTMASVTRWTIIVLNILFTSGLAIVICENLAELVAEITGTMEDSSSGGDYRIWVGLCLLPVVILLLQIPWLQDMWLISVLGLVIYTVGVIGSTLFSALWTISSADLDMKRESMESTIKRGMPDDLWAMKWQGIPSFVGTAVYALEGINLALPTAHSMQNESDATRVVTAGVLGYAAVTIVFATVGYAGGLGGGPGTGLTPAQCDVVTNCITPTFLKRIIQLALSLAMALSLPVMLYPSTEMLEVLLTDLQQQQQEEVQQEEDSLVDEEKVLLVDLESKLGEAIYGSTTTCSTNQPNCSRLLQKQETTTTCSTSQSASSRLQLQKQESFSQEKSWKLRIFLAILTVTMGALTNSFTFFSGLIGAVGLSFAGFVLPPLLYLRAMEQAKLPLPWSMKASMTMLAMFGLYNMVAGGASSLLELWQSFS